MKADASRAVVEMGGIFWGPEFLPTKGLTSWVDNNVALLKDDKKICCSCYEDDLSLIWVDVG